MLDFFSPYLGPATSARSPAFLGPCRSPCSAAALASPTHQPGSPARGLGPRGLAALRPKLPPLSGTFRKRNLPKVSHNKNITVPKCVRDIEKQRSHKEVNELIVPFIFEQKSEREVVKITFDSGQPLTPPLELASLPIAPLSISSSHSFPPVLVTMFPVLGSFPRQQTSASMLGLALALRIAARIVPTRNESISLRGPPNHKQA